MGDKGARQRLLVGREEGVEFGKSGKGAAIRQRARIIHRRSQLVGDPPSRLPFLGRIVAFSIRPVTLAEAADRIKALQGETRRIDLRMTGRTARVGTVFVELLTHRRRAARVGIDRGNSGRRRRGRIIEETVHHPDPSVHRRGGGAVGGELVDRRLS